MLYRYILLYLRAKKDGTKKTTTNIPILRIFLGPFTILQYLSSYPNILSKTHLTKNCFLDGQQDTRVRLKFTGNLLDTTKFEESLA